MDQFRIRGGRALQGEVEASGSKNAALPILTAALLADGPCRVRRVPALRDTATILELLGVFGVKSEPEGAGAFRLDPAGVKTGTAPYDLVRTMRASVLVLGPLLARFGHVRVSLPGGCAIGARPIDQHLKGLEALGAEITLADGYVEARTEGLRGARFSFDLITVTGTKNLMMAAALAEGTTILENAAREPEVAALAGVLNQMGAKIRGAGSPVIEIEGVKRLGGFEAEVPADRIETGTFLIAGAITRGDVTVRRCIPGEVRALILRLEEAGVPVSEGPDWVRVQPADKILPVNVKTDAHPGFPTDLQAQFMALMCTAEGGCTITETIFENRFMHAAELTRMGARITLDGRSARIEGVGRIKGATVMATDLRASASLVLAALSAEGETILRRVYHLDRGYERMEERLRAMGADIERMEE